MTTRIANQDARYYVLRKEAFMGSNMFGSVYEGGATGKVYVVHSYGTHFPMYLFDYQAGYWIGNTDKYSRTTTRHQSQARPLNIHKWVDTSTLIAIGSSMGIAQFLARRMSI
jgi:hypothetical protein